MNTLTMKEVFKYLNKIPATLTITPGAVIWVNFPHMDSYAHCLIEYNGNKWELLYTRIDSWPNSPNIIGINL